MVDGGPADAVDGVSTGGERRDDLHERLYRDSRLSCRPALTEDTAHTVVRIPESQT